MIEYFNNSQVPVANSEQQLDSEQFLTDIEKHKLLVEWNDTYRDYPQDKCIHELFEATVERAPNAVAVVFEGEQLTYRELNAKANQLAHYLQSLGVKPEVLVGICVERSFEMVVGILGILKAGGAYVPLDPAYPSERLAFMLEDASVPVLLTGAQQLDKLPQHRARIVCLDKDWSEIALLSEENPTSEVAPDNLAYVIYTSGSTGKPKGVLLAHRGLCNLVTAQIQLFDAQPDSRILQFASFSFDASVWEIFMALVAGATLVLARQDSLMPRRALVELVREESITTVTLPPSVLAVMPSAKLSALRTIIVAGEVCPPNLVARWAKERQFFNAYGPTEATVCATVALCTDGKKKPPIGRPIANTQVYLLDENLQPLPIGVPGELYIGGVGLARGYLNRPDLTREKFISNPFSNEPGSRLYKTGDLACYLPDGNIEFLGRIDKQVKLRGFRIELGEIESVLGQHPAVQLAAVVLREDVPNKKQLVAYVVHNREYAGKVAQKLIPDIRSFVQEKLPDYMVPSAFVLLDALPLTPNGKVARLALPAPDIVRPDLEENFVAPRTHIEEVLAGIWSKVLGLEQVGIHDKFLELGGHSLLAIQILSRLRDTLKVELPVDSLFASPTVAELALRISADDWEKSFKQAPPVQPISRNQNLPLSWSQEHMWFLAQLEPDAPVYNEPFTIRFGGAIYIDALEKAFNEIIKRHESLRTRFITVDGQPVQVIEPSFTFNLTVVDLRKLPQKERETEALRLATIDAKKRFDLTDGLLLRAKLMQLADEDYRLFLTCHHIVIDGFSVYGVFLKELETLYEAFSTGQPSSLTPLPIQYVDFALWQRQQTTQEILSSQLNYWKQQLADLPVLHLPYDRPRSARQTFRGARLCLALSKDLTLGLKALSQQLGITLYMTLLAAFKTLLYRYTGQSDIVVSTVSAGRNQPQIEELLGYFLNTLVLRTDLSGCPSFLELLSRVKEVTLGAYAREDLPFLQLVQTLQPERNLGQNPLFQVAFVLEPPMPSLRSGWTLSQLDIQTDTAKFDLTLELDDRPEGIIGRLEYNTDLFEASTISRMAGHFQTLLAGIVANPQQPISELPLLTEAERHQLLVEWNNTQTEYPQDKCIHQLFEEQVKRSPTSVAVVLEGEHLTYRQLNAKANQLAHYLQTLGVGPEVLVGICVERSLEMVVGLLGILKAGGAYVPLDPTYPPERLAFMLEDSCVSHLLTQERLVASLSPHQASVIHLDTHWKVIARESEENPNSGVTTENLAYVIYTSGSTGKPKGAMNTHRGICNRLLWMQDAYRLIQSDRVLQKTPFSFDVSVWEFFWPLLTGACIVVAQPERHKDSGYLVKLIAQQQVSTLHFVPSMLRVFLEEQNLEACRCLKRVICSGEALPFELQERFFARLDAELYNLYGPTEAAVDVTSWTCKRNSERRIVSIGRPIANTQIYLLDSQMQPVPIGVLGELHIGGIGLARGYFNRPDLTAEKFIPNPFNDKPGDRLYKTGDLARYFPDGNIEYLGRIDHQVKLRGFRIELGEIESLLGQHPVVRASAVIDREDVPGSKHLVAYVVPNQQEAINSGQPLLAQMEQLLVGQQRYELPNGMAIAHLNKNETDFLYQECFEDLAYLKHKITLNEGDCIFDVGANIGLFSLFVGQMCKNAVIYAFEPLPPIFEVLRINTTLYGLNAKLFEYGLGKKNHSDTFTYYPNISIISGRFANFQDEREVVKSFLLQQQSSTGTKTTLPSEELLDELLADRLKSEKFTCQLRTLSEVIRENGVERIDLLKINVEKSEMDVLEGIQEEDWQKIAQIMIEVHDINNRLESVTTLLKKHGYNLVIEQDAQFKDTDIHNIYAVRPTNSQRLPSKVGNKLGAEALDYQMSLDLTQLSKHWSEYANKPLQGKLARNLIPDIRNFLQEKLPDYMVPDRFAILEALPLTSNGKVNRRALRALDNWDRELKDNFVAPTTPTEETLASIWTEVLGMQQVGVNDNFFELGGHSLLATQIISRIRSAFSIELPLRSLFEAPTIASLAQVIETAERERLQEQFERSTKLDTLPPLVPVVRDTHTPLSFAQQMVWDLQQLHIDSCAYNSPVALCFNGLLRKEILEKSINEIIRRHQILRTTFTVVNEQPVQIIASFLTLPLNVIDLQHLPQHEQEVEAVRLANQEALHHFDLASAPLIKTTLLCLAPQKHWLLITMHHIITDGWSYGIFLQELETLYEAFSKRLLSPLPELTIQYAYFTLWQQKYLNEETLEKQRSYWLQKLANIPPRLDLLPTFPPKLNNNNNKQVRSYSIVLPYDRVDSIAALSRLQEVTIFAIILAALKILLYKLSGQTDTIILATTANRSTPEVEKMLGCFINDLFLRDKIDNSQTGYTFIKQVNQTICEALANQEIPEKLLRNVRELEFIRTINVSMAPPIRWNSKILECEVASIRLEHELWDEENFPLEIYIYSEGEDSRRIEIISYYSTNCFTDESIEYFFRGYQEILKQFFQHSEKKLCEFVLTASG